MGWYVAITLVWIFIGLGFSHDVIDDQKVPPGGPRTAIYILCIPLWPLWLVYGMSRGMFR